MVTIATTRSAVDVMAAIDSIYLPGCKARSKARQSGNLVSSLPGVSTSHSRYRQLLPLAATHLVGLVCGVISVKWISAVVPPDVLGLYGLLTGATQAAFVVTHQGFIKHVQRTWTRTTPARGYLAGLLAAAGVPSLWLAFGLFGVLLVLHSTGGVPLHPSTYLWLVAANLGVAIVGVLQAALQAEERYWAGFASSTLGSASRSFVPPLLATLLGAELVILGTGFLAHVAILIVGLSWQMRGAWRRAGGSDTPTNGGLHLTLRAFAAAGLCIWVASASTRWMAALVLDAEQVGLFVLAGNLSLVVPAAVGSIVLSYSFPSLFSRARAGALAEELEALNYRAVAALLVVSQAGLLLLDWLAPSLVGPVISIRYAPATAWLLATGNATLAATTIGFFLNVLLACGRESACLWLSLVSLALRAGLMFAGVRGGPDTFSAILVAMPWLTVVVEGVCAHWLVRHGPRLN